LKTKRDALVATALSIAAVFGLQALAAPQTSIDTWKSIMSQADLAETEHDHSKAIQYFRAAGSLAEKNGLPLSCLETSLCRQTAVEVLANLIAQADADLESLLRLIQQEKAKKTLDPDLEVWMQNLANAYQANLAPRTREDCLLKLCQINKVLYGDDNKEYKNARTLLGKYYENGQAVKAARIQTSSDEDGIKQAELNSDPLQRAFNLNQLALHCRTTGELERAKTADLQLLKMAKTSPQIADGLVTYLATLGTIEMAQGNLAQGKSYFAAAIKECSKFRGNNQKEGLATGSLKGLVDAVKADKNPQIPNLAGDELDQLLAVQQAISSDPRGQYALNRILVGVLQEEHKYEEADKHTERAIEIAHLPFSMVSNDIPGLYTRLATSQVFQGQFEKSDETFTKALAAVPNKTGFDATQILIFWGGRAVEHKRLPLASEKLNLALKNAEGLPAQKRGTLLIDALHGVAAVATYRHAKEDELRPIVQRSYAEIKLQRKINSGLGPDFFQMLNANL
jgi:tetratricopeptide (TPR) repeat protein